MKKVHHWIKRTKRIVDQVADHVERVKKETEAEQAKDMAKQALPQPDRTIKADISFVTAVKLAIAGLIVWQLFAYASLLTSLVVILLFSFIFSSALAPIIDRLQDRKIPRVLSILVCYILILGVLVLIISLYAPALANQIVELMNWIIGYIQQITSNGVSDIPFYDQINRILQVTNEEQIIKSLEKVTESITSSLSSMGANALGAVTGLLGGLASFVTVLIVTFFMLTDRDSVGKFVRSLVPSEYEKYAVKKLEVIEHKMGGWVRGQLMMMVIMWALMYMVLTILKIPYAAPLALLAGICEIIPIAGFFISMIPVVIIAFLQSPLVGIAALVAIAVVQVVEGNILVPIVMRQAVGLSPIVIILALLVGAQLGGILGVILCIPVATILSVFINDYQRKPKG